MKITIFMKLKSLLFLTLAAGAMIACSNDDETGLRPIKAEATLSFTVGTNNAITKADGDKVITGDMKIKSLTLFVFNAGDNAVKGAFDANNYTKGQLAYTARQEYGSTAADSAVISTGMALQPGNVDILLIANVDAATYSNVKSESDLTNMTDLLSKQDTTNLGLTMCSALIQNVTLAKGTNYYGFYQTHADANDIAKGNPVMLYRTVAAVRLNSVALSEVGAKFKMTQVFLANVKDKCSVYSATGNGTVELSTAGYLAGANGAATSILKTVANTETPTLLMSPGKILTGTTWDATPAVLSHYFYVNENNRGLTSGAANCTLLEVAGYYTKPGAAENTKDLSYYVITVNRPADTQNTYTSTTGQEGTYINRNTKYIIDLTITGEGSVIPHQNNTIANIAVKIRVADWNVVDMGHQVVD